MWLNNPEKDGQPNPSQIAKFRGQHGAHLGPVGPRWAPCWPHEPCYQGCHYNDVIKCAIASQITSLTIVYSIVYSDADQRKHQSSTLLAFVWGIHRGPANSSHKWPVTRKMFPFVDVIMVAWRLASLDMGLSLNDSFVSSLTIGFKYLWGYIRAYFKIWHIIFIQHIQHAKDYPNE